MAANGSASGPMMTTVFSTLAVLITALKAFSSSTVPGSAAKAEPPPTSSKDVRSTVGPGVKRVRFRPDACSGVAGLS